MSPYLNEEPFHSNSLMAKPKNISLFLVRLLALAATLSATIVMATSHESTTIFNLTFEAKYSDAPAFKFFVIVNAVGSGYTLLVLFLPSESLFRRISVAVDVVITVLLTSGSSAALGIAYVGKKGNNHAGWLPICDQVPNFCNQVTGSLVAGFIGVILYMLLILHSVHTVLNPL